MLVSCDTAAFDNAAADMQLLERVLGTDGLKTRQVLS